MTELVLYDHPGPRAERRARVATVVGGAIVLAIGLLVVWRLVDRGHFSADKWDPFADPLTWNGIFEGLVNTLKAAVLAIILAMLTGFLLAVGRLSERAVVRAPATVVIEFFRATPVLMLMLFFYLASPDTLGPYGAIVTALTLYNGAVLAEVFRSGIQAVPRGQSEAAYSLGLRKAQVMMLVLVPQAVRIMLPAIVSQCVVALKDTALGSIVAYSELTRVGRQIYDNYFNIIPAVIVVTIIYVAMNMSLSWLAHWLERRQRRRYGEGAVLHADLDVGKAV